jgi:hypothetical protein
MRALHCVFCGNQLSLQGGELYCERGETGFAAIVEQAVREAVEKVKPAQAAASPRVGESLFRCPNCANGLVAKAGAFTCELCGVRLPLALHHILVEHHSHAGHQ